MLELPEEVNVLLIINCLFKTLMVFEITLNGWAFDVEFSGNSSMVTLQVTLVPLSSLKIKSTVWFLNICGTF